MKKHSYDFVKNQIELSGYILLSTDYKNNETKLLIKCNFGHVYECKFSNFQQGKRCAECKGLKRHSYEFVKQTIESLEGYKLLSNNYQNNRTKLKIKCNKGHIYHSIFTSFQSGSRCRKCSYKKIGEDRKGKNHPNYNPLLTDVEREIKRSLDYQKNNIWRSEVFERDSYTCQICKVTGGNLQAHHLFNWADYPEKRFEVSNGVTLCKKHHTHFHKTFGYTDNDPIQFRTFQIACDQGVFDLTSIVKRNNELRGIENNLRGIIPRKKKFKSDF